MYEFMLNNAICEHMLYKADHDTIAETSINSYIAVFQFKTV